MLRTCQLPLSYRKQNGIIVWMELTIRGAVCEWGQDIFLYH